MPFPTPELLAPAGDWDCVRAAVANGADAVYFGLEKFNARMRATNFTQEDLPEVMEFLHRHGVKGYVTLNVLIFTEELASAIEELRLLEQCQVDAVIIQDVGLANAARHLTPHLPIHASTQMSITSPEGIAFAKSLSISQVVLAREISLRELQKFSFALPCEVFVHGALCVAYSGQCLTSEALGQRSANRGECAQACRMPYSLIVDGNRRELVDRHYLLSPQDLAAVQEIPDLIAAGIRSFKIEGRLKSPEYVAAVTSVYRKAIDQALQEVPTQNNTVSAEDWYRLEMTFSRGLFTGWLHGNDHQKLVLARFGKKRGPFAGKIIRIGTDWIELDGTLSIQAGDGVVFDTGGDPDQEQGGRVFSVQQRRLWFAPRKIDFRKLQLGDRVWKTDDPHLMKSLRRSWAGHLPARSQNKRPILLRVTGSVNTPLQIDGKCGEHSFSLVSRIPLEPAQKQALQKNRFQEALGKLEETPFVLTSIEWLITDSVFLPLSELSHLRRAMLAILEAPALIEPSSTTLELLLKDVANLPIQSPSADTQMIVLCRDFVQIEAALEVGIDALILDFEDIRRLKEATTLIRKKSAVPLFLATPRIQKVGEKSFFTHIEQAKPDGVLIRNIGAIEYFRGKDTPMIGDFSLNIANPLSAGVFLEQGLQRVTISYDLTVEQILPLLRAVPLGSFEITLHQHIPMFHMEHCVFAAFLSNGKDFTDCGRPCEKHKVHLRDRVGQDHPLRADVGCRNTLFRMAAQTGASYFFTLYSAGLRHFRIELLEENAAQTHEVLSSYRQLLQGEIEGDALWRKLKLKNQLGVTKGTLDSK